jgi:hypothetical protein
MTEIFWVEAFRLADVDFKDFCVERPCNELIFGSNTSVLRPCVELMLCTKFSELRPCEELILHIKLSVLKPWDELILCKNFLC